MARCFAETAVIGVHAHYERPSLRPRRPDDRRAVTGTQIDDRPLVAGDQPIELADVDLGKLTSDGDAHGSMIAHVGPPDDDDCGIVGLTAPAAQNSVSK